MLNNETEISLFPSFVCVCDIDEAIDAFFLANLPRMCMHNGAVKFNCNASIDINWHPTAKKKMFSSQNELTITTNGTAV